MDSINTILNSRKFQREAPDRLKHLIRRHRRETFKPDATAFLPMSPTDKTERKESEPNRKTIQIEKQDAA